MTDKLLTIENDFKVIFWFINLTPECSSVTLNNKFSFCSSSFINSPILSVTRIS